MRQYGVVMAYVIACLMAALSFLLNRLALRYIGLDVVITCSPVLEELAKTLLAYYLGADILLTHVVFGGLEAVYDWHTSESHGAAAAMLSIVGHAFFGLVTVGVLSLTASLPAAQGAGIVVHLAWNVTIIRLTI